MIKRRRHHNKGNRGIVVATAPGTQKKRYCPLYSAGPSTNIPHVYYD
jgi:hypothetical protein